jgi:hypothetical protein
VDAGTPEQMSDTFLDSAADYVHPRVPVLAGGEVIASVGASVAPVGSAVCVARGATRKPRITACSSKPMSERERGPELHRATRSQLNRGASCLALPSGHWQTRSVVTGKSAGWDRDVEIAVDLYERALSVFQSLGAIARRHRYQEVVG